MPLVSVDVQTDISIGHKPAAAPTQEPWYLVLRGQGSTGLYTGVVQGWGRAFALTNGVRGSSVARFSTEQEAVTALLSHLCL